MFIHNTLIYNIKPDLSINNDNIKALQKLLTKTVKNILINTQKKKTTKKI